MTKMATTTPTAIAAADLLRPLLMFMLLLQFLRLLLLLLLLLLQKEALSQQFEQSPKGMLKSAPKLSIIHHARGHRSQTKGLMCRTERLDSSVFSGSQGLGSTYEAPFSRTCLNNDTRTRSPWLQKVVWATGKVLGRPYSVLNRV